MVKNRLFTLGCSHTQHQWPSWSDFIGYFFNEYYNYGSQGSGNGYIHTMLFEIDEKYKLTKDDTVLIMLSDENRADFISPTRWTAAGNIYAPNNLENYGERFVKDIWSPAHGLNNTWVVCKSIHHFLTNKGCKFKIFKAFPDFEESHLWSDDRDYQLGVGRKLQYTTGKSLYHYENLDVPRYEFYIDGELRLDGHLRLEEHLEWVKNEASEYYDEHMEKLLEEWEPIALNKKMVHSHWEFLFKDTHKGPIIFGEEITKEW